MRTLGHIVAEVRGILQDVVTPHRYPDADIYRALNFAVADARRLRPDFFAAAPLAPLPFYTPGDSAAPLPIPDEYGTALAYYVAGRMELRDDQFNADTRAGMLLAAFKAQLSTAAA